MTTADHLPDDWSHAPDLRGVWEVVSIDDDGAAVLQYRTVEGIAGTDGEPDAPRPVRVVASFEDGAHVLRPVALPVRVVRRDG
jgi:hypothetical protein